MSWGSILEEASKRYTQASKVTAQIIDEEVKPVIEEVKNIRERMCGRKINGRLHTMPFKKVQSYITYKSRGFPPEMVSTKKPRKRPICGESNKSNGHAFECGLQADKHIAAPWKYSLNSCGVLYRWRRKPSMIL